MRTGLGPGSLAWGERGSIDEVKNIQLAVKSQPRLGDQAKP